MSLFYKKNNSDNNTIEKLQMMISFNANGGNISGLDLETWKLAWNIARHSTEKSSEQDFQTLSTHKNQSNLSFDKKTFHLAWCVSKNFHSYFHQLSI